MKTDKWIGWVGVKFHETLFPEMLRGMGFRSFLINLKLFR